MRVEHRAARRRDDLDVSNASARPARHPILDYRGAPVLSVLIGASSP